MKKIYLLTISAFFNCAIINAQTAPVTKAPATKAPAAKTAVAKPAVAKAPAAPITKIYSMVIKGGHVIDPKNNIDGIMDIAIATAPAAAGGRGGGGGGRGGGGAGKIALIAKNIDGRLAREVIDAKGLYVTPGLIDIHSHNFWGTNGLQYGNGPNSLPPDGFTFRSGVTTIVDAGSPGWKDFQTYRFQTIQRSRTRVLVWLNIVGGGMRGEGRYESDTTDMNADSTAKVALANKDVIVGIKVAHYTRGDWIPVDRGEKAAVMANNIPLIIDFGGSGNVKPPLSLPELLLKRFRPGDIFTHCFAQLDYRDFIVDTVTNMVKPFVLEARKRGINFDVGYGGISFSYTQAVPAVQQGFYPTSISTDMHTGSMNAAMKDMLTCMSKFLAMGVPLKEVIAESTWNPAKEIRREELGNLSVGSDADIALIGMRIGKFGLFDYTGRKIETTKKLECEMTIRGGQIVYDLNGRAAHNVIKILPSAVASTK